LNQLVAPRTEPRYVNAPIHTNINFNFEEIVAGDVDAIADRITNSTRNPSTPPYPEPEEGVDSCAIPHGSAASAAPCTAASRRVLGGVRPWCNPGCESSDTRDHLPSLI
jgi:hypothetical protein